MRVSCGILIAVLAVLANSAGAAGQSAGSVQDKCEQLASFQLPNAGISWAKMVEAGTFTGPPNPFSGVDLTPVYKQFPAFCRVVVHAKPSADSDIVIELWMPAAGWNGKLQGLGNGGFAGQIDYAELGAAITKGYAAVATDTGHAGSPIDATWAVHHPERVTDFGHRGIHEMTRVAKAGVRQFYGDSPKHSYFAGCSDGGREALMEAQRYPEDYDGILAGAPAYDWTKLLTTAVVDTQALTSTPGSFIPQAKIPALAHAVVAACDELDAVKDGILNDPRQCQFDPASIQCKTGEDTDSCLTPPQVAALKKIYSGIQDASGRTLFPGYVPGGEEGPGGWGRWITGPAPAKSLMAFFGIGYFADMVYEKPDWDYKSFIQESGLDLARQKTAGALDATNPDLSAFRSRGGKLILYHGWNDPAITALSTVNYYNEVAEKAGKTGADAFVRLYMIPGMQHCSGGPGADTIGQSGAWPSTDPRHNARLALEKWVESGVAPTTLVATKRAGEPPQGAPVMTRLLCPYPQSAKYKGTGDPSHEESFACAAPAK